MDQFSGDVLWLMKRAASEQAGIISGDNPAKYNETDPLRLWVIQVAVIVIFTQLLSLVFARIRQPRVIAEVIGGVLLGPTVMGRIPNFSNSIFPSQSYPLLTLTANVGLVFFLFLIGLEVDVTAMRRNARAAFLVSAVGLILPLGLGAALAVPIYHTFVNDDVNFGYFILFVAVAVGITAFPVLCRILTETRLLDTPVGVVVLGAGVGNDVVGWVLLALTVALVNASTGLTALWVLLTGVGFVLFMLFPVKWAFRWLARKTGSLEGSPSMLMMTVTFLMVLVSAFFTDIIGIHPIFGGFLAGLIIPHEGGFAIALVEKLEDFISLIFLPLYFALSGLRTNLGLLDNGKTWGYTILICVVAFFAKFLGCFAAAKFSGFTFRESGAIGTLMSCKGLVELIVLNVGLQAGVLDTRTFSMFVLHAIVLTFITTPLTLLWYPERVRHRAQNVVKDKPSEDGRKDSGGGGALIDDTIRTKFAVVLSRVEHLQPIMTLAQLLQQPAPPRPISSGSSAESSKGEKSAMQTSLPVELSALRLVELTERTSAVLRSQEAAVLASADALLGIVRTCGRMHRLSVDSDLAVVPSDAFARQVSYFVNQRSSQIVVIPWSLSLSHAADSTLEEPHVSVTSPLPAALHNPFEGFFHASSTVGSGSVVYSAFIRKVFAESPADVALFIDRNTLGFPTGSALEDLGGHHIFLPFFGGPDDRLALELVVQLCTNASASATVVRINITEEGSGEDTTLERPDTVEHEKATALTRFTISGPAPNADTQYGVPTTQTRLQSETADDLVWGRYTSPSDSSLSPSTLDALTRITFHTISSSQPLHTALGRAADLPGTIVLAGRGRRMARTTHRAELKKLLISAGHTRDHGAAGGEMSRTVGDIAAAFLLAPQATTSGSVTQGAVIVVQAAIGRGQTV